MRGSQAKPGLQRKILSQKSDRNSKEKDTDCLKTAAEFETAVPQIWCSSQPNLLAEDLKNTEMYSAGASNINHPTSQLPEKCNLQ